MFQIIFLQRKLRNSPAKKLIQSKFNEKQCQKNNQLYKVLKEQVQQSQTKKQQLLNFQTQIQRKMSSQPTKIIGSLFYRKKTNYQVQKQRKKFKNDALLNNKRYQTSTKASLTKKHRRTHSALTDYNQKNQNHQSSITLNKRTKTSQSFYTNLPKNSKKQSRKFSFHQLNNKYVDCTILGKQTQTFQHGLETYFQSPIDIYNEVVLELIKKSKKVQQSIARTQKNYDHLQQINNKINHHFSQLILEPNDFNENQSLELYGLGLQQRYKFTSNNILQNVLSKNDDEVQTWIERQRTRRLNMKSRRVIRQFTKGDILSKQKIKKMEELMNFQKQYEKNKKFNNLLENSEEQINRLKLQRRILDQKTLTIKNQHSRPGSPYKKSSHNLSKTGNNFKTISQYQKKKFMSKTVYNPKRSFGIVKLK